MVNQSANSRRIAQLEAQVSLLTSCFLGVSQLLEEKTNISHDEVIRRVNAIHKARMHGVTEEQFSYRKVAESLTVINSPINLNGKGS